MPQLEEMMDNHCEQCHTATCGQCHVSRPARLGGGLVAGHLFKDTQAINLTCGGCHGNRIEDEYKGHNGSVPGDVHWVQGKMLCSDCHGAEEFHGMVEEFVHRYDGGPMPSCVASRCHPDVAEDDGIEQHGDSHLKYLSCQACHSTTYKNCYGCHVRMEGEEATFALASTQFTFKIGRNPIRDRYRPWKFVPVRHVPIALDSFAYYGQGLLPNFDALPTWKYTTPHNIQRITPQTETCNSCHGNTEVFLTAGDVAFGEMSANRRVVVEEVPAPVE
jgi:thiosulfate/3-mercaptopyruvate sulfurtransferase